MSSGSFRGLGDSFLELQAHTGLGLPNLVGVVPPHCDDIELVHLSLSCALHASYPWEVRLIFSNEVGNVDRDQ